MDRSEVFDWIATGNPRDRRTCFETLQLQMGLDSGRQMTQEERLDMVRNAIGLAYLKHFINLRNQDSDIENQAAIRDRSLTMDGLSELGLLAVVIPGAGSENDNYITEHEYGVIGERANIHSGLNLTINSFTMLWNDLRKQYRNFSSYREEMSLNPTLIKVKNYLRERHWEGLFNPEGLISLDKLVPAIETIADKSPTDLRERSLLAGLAIVNFMKETN